VVGRWQPVVKIEFCKGTAFEAAEKRLLEQELKGTGFSPYM
jgi:hypothetical protein